MVPESEGQGEFKDYRDIVSCFMFVLITKKFYMFILDSCFKSRNIYVHFKLAVKTRIILVNFFNLAEKVTKESRGRG